MAKLPDFTALGSEPAPSVPQGVASYEPGNPRYVGVEGSEMAQAGREVQGAAEIFAAMNARQDEIVAQDAGNKLQQASITAEFDPNTGFRNVRGGNAVGQQFTDAYTQKLDQQAQQIRESLQNDEQRRLFDKHAALVGLQYRSALLQHQSRETEAFNDKTADDTINLAMRKMAQDPTNELTFQTGLAQINGTLESAANRKGLPPETLAELKGKYTDAAYFTRIMSVLQGIPGTVSANPYMAEKLFEQVQSQLGPQAQVQLAHQVQKGVQSVQARDTAQAFIFGNGALDPKQVAPAVTGSPLQAVVLSNESGGQRYDPQGNLLTSPAGAQGEMQVMPATARDPGYGVTPARDNSAEELARVGRDYLGAMTARYNDPALVLAAYNAGPGKVDQWIAKYGDPRTGAISPQDWASRIPFAETRDYVAAGLKKLAAQNGSDSINSPTKNQLKMDLYQRVQAARQVAERQYPGDTAYADGVAARVENYGRTVLADQQAQEAAARDTLMMGLIGQKQDGSDKPTSLDGLLADPQMQSAWNRATPETKLALQERFAKGDKGFTSDTFNTYYQLKGQAANDPESFTQLDLGQYFGKVPDAALHELVQMQTSISKKDATAAARDLNWNKARSTVDDMLKPLGLGRTAKPKSPLAAQTEVFYGKLSDALQQYHDQNNKWPDTPTTRQMAAGLLAEGKQGGGMLWDSGTRFFQSPDASQFYVPLPSDSKQVQQLSDSFTKVMGRAPTKAELQAYYTKYRLAGGK
jgi:hypothetical protein